jgi:hypothetical protein
VRQCLLGRVPAFDAVRQQASHEGHGVVAYVEEQLVGERVRPLHDHGPDGLVIPAVERRRSRQEHVRYDPEAPQVTCLGVALLEDLRRDVPRRADDAAQPMAGGVVRRKAKVDELQRGPDVLVRLEDPVLELEVAVADVLRVEEGDCREHLGQSLGCEVGVMMRFVKKKGNG